MKVETPDPLDVIGPVDFVIAHVAVEAKEFDLCF